MQRITSQNIVHELHFVTSRSSGPGGQHINKTNSRVTLRWNVANSTALTHEQRLLSIQKLARYISHDGDLVLHAQTSRSQLQNKSQVIQKLDTLLQKAFAVKKKRMATRPTSASRLKRLEGKKRKAEKKQWRKKLY
ncbi:MAG: aminoacyl-tRNA hydrolase [Flammeovirgaceae bacterium]|nr:MAG: aminoacyl-tRNA hydrolase [Flammeovirgaceae bacterium]